MTDPPPTFVSSELDSATGVLTITFSEEIDATPATNVVPTKIHVRESGSYTGGITLAAGELGTAADGATISFTLTVPHLATVAGLTTPELTIEPGAVRDTSDNLIVGTFDVSTAVFVDAFSVSSEEATPRGMAFSSDGAKMFVVGSGGDEINEYALSTAFDASTATHVDATPVSSQDSAPTGMAFSSDGTKMFVVGSTERDINEYALSTAFDASTATFVDAFSVLSQDNFPTGMAFSNDGAKMFIVGNTGGDVNEYALSTAFDASTATFVDATSVASQETAPQGMAFSSDGAKMFVIGNTGDDINEYALSTPFDASTAAFVDAFSVSSQEIDPQGMAFSSDGAKMFVVGSIGDDVNEYDLHSVYPITVTDPPPTFVSSELDSATGVLAITFSEEIDVTPATQVVPTKIHVRESGSYTGGVTLASGELGTAADGATISFTLTASHLATVAGLTTPELTIEPGAVRDTSDNLIVGTFDVSTAVFVDAFSVSSQDSAPTGMAFSSDGAKMFVIGSDGDDVNEYALSTAFDASTAVFVDATSVSSQENNPRGVAFSSDGTKMFVVGTQGDDINEYALSTAFDASTATFVDATSVSQDPTPQDVAFSNGGTKMFVVGFVGAEINEYTLSTAFDASTATFVDTTSVSPQETGPTGMAFSSDGAKMFVVGSNGNRINEYALSTAFDASTHTFVDYISIVLRENAPTGMAFSSDGAKMFVVGTQGDDVNEYDLHSVYPITVAGTPTPPAGSTPPTFVSSELDSATGALTITFSEEIDATPATNVVPTKIHVRESGSYTGGITLAAGELGTTADGATISFTLSAPHRTTVAGLATPELTIDPGAVRDTSDNLIVGTFDASTAVFVDAFSVSSEETAPQGMAFSSDGAKMFVIGSDGDEINEYTLSTAFDASTATHVDATSVSSQDSFPTGMAFSSDGAKMFVTGYGGGDINEYALSTAFDVSTATFVDATSVSSQEDSPEGMAFSSDGAKMFVVGNDGNDINEYALSTAFDASTAVFVDAFSVSSQETSPTGMAFSSDGAKMFVVGSIEDEINEYALSTAFDVSTATLVDATSVSSQDLIPTGMAFSSDGAKMFVVGTQGDDVNEYDLHSVYPITVTGTSTTITIAAGADQTVGEEDLVTLSGSAAYSGSDSLTYAWSHDSTEHVITFANSSSPATTFAAPVVTSDATITLTLTVSDGTDTAADDMILTVKETGGAFITTWSMNSGETLTLSPVSGTYSVIWGDGAYTGEDRPSHQYASSGTFTVSMLGDITHFNMRVHPTLAPRLQSVEQWGDTEWDSMENMFEGASNMQYRATDTPDLSGVTDMERMFQDASSFDGDISSWNVSNVQTMNSMFLNAATFSQDLSSWDVSNVQNMQAMFRGTTLFNSDISGWDVSSVTSISGMFANVDSFNQPLDSWNVSGVSDMSSMFSGATSFNKPLGSWNVAAVTDMSSMFDGADSFNQDISSWDVSSVTSMGQMFDGADSFEQNLGKWYVIPNDTVIARTDVPGVVGSISAQNSYLDGHSPTYGIGTGGDSALFDIVNGNELNMTSVGTESAYTVVVTASGSSVFESGNNWRMLDVTVTGQANAVPVLGAIGARSVNELATLSLTATATDGDNDALTFTLVGTPPLGASITSGGAFSWTPSESQDGTHTTTIQVEDGNGGIDFETITVTVIEVNADPVLASVGSRSVDELASLAFTATATDGDVIGGTADTLEFSLGAGAPTGASINQNTGAFSWTPSESQDGTHAITIQVEDGAGATDSEAVTVTVSEVNEDPVLNPIGPKSVNQLEALTFTATASDVDVISGTADTLTFSLPSGPTGASITQSTGSFSWTPTASQVGTHTITFQVEDGAGATDSEAVTVTVSESNENPVLGAIGAKGVNELAALTFTATATDGDNDALTFTLVGTPPSGASITSGGAFSWTPSESQDGTHSVTARVSDGNGGSDSETITVTVGEVNQDPALNPIGPKGVNRPGTLAFTATASDGDVIGGTADSLEFSLAGTPPSGASITPGGAFSWTPTESQIGTHTITIQVEDGAGAADSGAVTVRVTADSADPPTTRSGGGGGGSSRQAPALALDLGTVRSTGLASTPQEIVLYLGTFDPDEPIQPTGDAGRSDPPLVINGSAYLLGGTHNTLEPQALRPGEPTDITFTVYSTADIVRFAVNMSRQGADAGPPANYTLIRFSDGAVSTVDPGGLIADADVAITRVSGAAYKYRVQADVEFADVTGLTDMVITSENARGASTTVHVASAFEVLPPAAAQAEPDAPAPEPEPDMPAPEPDAPSYHEPPASPTAAFRMWAEFGPATIGDAGLAAALGLDYPGAEIPTWVKTGLAPLVVNGYATVDEFATALEYVLGAIQDRGARDAAGSQPADPDAAAPTVVSIERSDPAEGVHVRDDAGLWGDVWRGRHRRGRVDFGCPLAAPGREA